jgi:lysophospholipase L1-like esterase
MNKFLAAAVLAASLTAPLHAAENWVASWQASPHAAWRSGDFVLPTGIPDSLAQQTVRETARISVGGRRVRIVLSNRYGSQPLVVGEAHVARAAGAGGGIAPGTDQVLTFGGQRGTVIPAGAPAVSDALEMPLAALEKLAVSVYLPQKTPLATFHWGAQQTGHIAAGNVASAAALPGATPLHGRALLAGIWVDAEMPARAVVAFGDSITDGNGSTPDSDRRWPDQLAGRLGAGGVAVVNAGISGARLLGDRMGANAAARFEQDVLAQPGVRSVIVALGINDIGWPASAFAPHDPAMEADMLVAGYRKLIERARASKVRVIGATMAPFENALQGTPLSDHYSPAKDAVRRLVNDWIRSSGAFDAVVDFDAVLRDPAHPSRLLPSFDSGDHLHPGDAGYEAMAQAVYAALERCRAD